MNDRVIESLGAAVGTLRAADIRVEYVGSAGIVAQHSYGSGILLQAGGPFFCTSAFAVTAGSVTGVLTAAHCNQTTDYLENSGNSYWANSQGSYLGNAGDFRWVQTAHTAYGSFYSAYNQLRDVTGWQPMSTMAPNQWVCVYGRSSGTHCRTIKDVTNVCGYQGSTLVCNLIKMNGGGTASGDSGAPWFGGITAWGIHTGTLGGDAIFSTVDKALSNLSVSLIVP